MAKGNSVQITLNHTSSVRACHETVIQDTSQAPNSQDSGYLGSIRAHVLYISLLYSLPNVYQRIFNDQVGHRSASHSPRIGTPATHVASVPFATHGRTCGQKAQTVTPARPYTVSTDRSDHASGVCQDSLVSRIRRYSRDDPSLYPAACLGATTDGCSYGGIS